jgi:hypothetical protein
MLASVDSGPILQGCRAWRARYDAAHDAARAFAKSLGSQGYFGGLKDQVVALLPSREVPEGWRVVRGAGRRKDMMVPRKGKPGQAAREALASLPQFPDPYELAQLVGPPLSLEYWNDRGEAGTVLIGNPMHPVQLCWSHDRMVLVLPDVAASVAELRKSGWMVRGGDWALPDGLSPMTEAEWELLVAQHRVEDERAASGRAA